MLVADETLGGTPKLKNIGLNIDPPPYPKAPETHPPRNPNRTSFIITSFVYLRSLSTMPIPSLSLSICSFFTIVREMKVMAAQTTTKTPYKVQSTIVHFSKFTIEAVSSLPLIKVRSMMQASTNRHSKCF